MIPSILIIRSDKKWKITLIQKRNLKIGDQEDADILVNHTSFRGRALILDKTTLPGNLPKWKKFVRHFILPNYKYQVDGFKINLFPVKTLFVPFIFMMALYLPISLLWTDKADSIVSQDWDYVILPADGTYGFCRQDQKHPFGVRFQTEIKENKAYKLTFFIGGEGDGTKISFSLNGSLIEPALILPAGWGDEQSIILPSDKVKAGNNIIEVLPIGNSGDFRKWGISKIATIPYDQEEDSISEGQAFYPGSVLDALKKQNISGPELSRMYETVLSWDLSDNPAYYDYNKINMIGKIERRMKDKLHEVGFIIRSKKITGDSSHIHDLLDETQKWIPDGWVEGWNIFYELNR